MKIFKPTLLLDEQRCRQNISKMAAKARQHGLVFRPHFKTHQSREVGQWFREEGVTAITVSSVDMARYFADDGWSDITIAFPVNLREIDSINELANQVNLSIILESETVCTQLDSQLSTQVSAFITIDTGNGRTGIPINEKARIQTLAETIRQSTHIEMKGLLTHAGHTYHAKSTEEILAIHHASTEGLIALKRDLQGIDEEWALSIGDTPSCSLATSFADIDEIRPGVFTFYDLMQWHLGACEEEEIAICIACPVVAVHPDRDEVVIYGGAIHFSKETTNEIYGYQVSLSPDGWGLVRMDRPLIRLSQEHGILHWPKHDQPEVGEIVGIIPVHACLTANLMGGYQTLDGNWIDHFSGKPKILQSAKV